MSRSIQVIAMGLLASSAGWCQAADQPTEIADLFPPSTLAFAELHDTAALSPQLAAVFKGTILEDSIPFIHGRKDSAKTLMELANKREIALLGLLASPELLAEFKKLRIGAGVTGFTANGEPEAAVVILTRDSPAIGLAARAYLTMSPQLRKVAEVAKVPVFQYRSPNITYDPNGNAQIQHDKPFSDGPHELTFAYTPGLFVVGTSMTAIGHAMKRFRGEEKGGGLGGTAAFKEAAAAHRQTGLFYFVNYQEFAAKFGSAERQNGRPRSALALNLQALVAGGECDLYELFNITSNPKAVKCVAGCVRFRDGGLSATMAATFDPAVKSPLLDFLSGPGVKLEFLHHAPRPATMAFAVTLPEKHRAAAVIGFLDGVAKSTGELGRLPHDVVKELEGRHKLAVSEGLIAKVNAVTIMMPTRQELPKAGKPGPTLVLHTADDAAATAWEEFFPRLLADLGGARRRRTAVAGDNQRDQGVHSAGYRLAVERSSPLRPQSRNDCHRPRSQAGRCCRHCEPRRFGHWRGAGRLPPGGNDPAAFFGVVSLGEVLPGLFAHPRPSGPVVPIQETVLMPNGQPVPENVIADLKKARKELTASLATLAPATLTARRMGNELRFELFQPKMQNGAMKTIIDAGMNWIDKSSSLAGMGQRYQELEIIKGLW